MVRTLGHSYLVVGGFGISVRKDFHNRCARTLQTFLCESMGEACLLRCIDTWTILHPIVAT